jgi:hypothetical protein
LLKAQNAFVHPLAPPAGIGIVNEDGLPYLLQMIYQDVMDDAVSEIGREDLAQLGTDGKKADRTGGTVRAGYKLLPKREQVFFLPCLKAECVQRVSLVPPALDILPVDISE